MAIRKRYSLILLLVLVLPGISEAVYPKVLNAFTNTYDFVGLDPAIPLATGTISNLTTSTLTVNNVFVLTPLTGAAIRALTPGATGQYYNCSDCATVTTCVSTGVAAGAFSLITNKGSTCQ